jgi:hypothetical protein
VQGFFNLLPENNAPVTTKTMPKYMIYKHLRKNQQTLNKSGITIQAKMPANSSAGEPAN